MNYQLDKTGNVSCATILAKETHSSLHYKKITHMLHLYSCPEIPK